MSFMATEEIEMYYQILDEYLQPRAEKYVSIYRKVIGLMKMWKKANLLGDYTEETAQIMINCLILCIAIIRNGEDFKPITTNEDRVKIKNVLVKIL